MSQIIAKALNLIVPQLVGGVCINFKQTATLSANFRAFGRFCQLLKPISFLQDLLEFYVALGRKPLRKRLRKASADSTSPFFLVQNFTHM
jgi:hypothetical protein